MGPKAVDGVAVGGEGAGVFGADGSDFEFQERTGDGHRGGFDGHDALIEAVEKGVEETVFLTIQMENEVELRFSSLQRALIVAFEMRDGLRGSPRGRDAE